MLRNVWLCGAGEWGSREHILQGTRKPCFSSLPLQVVPKPHLSDTNTSVRLFETKVFESKCQMRASTQLTGLIETMNVVHAVRWQAPAHFMESNNIERRDDNHGFVWAPGTGKGLIQPPESAGTVCEKKLAPVLPTSQGYCKINGNHALKMAKICLSCIATLPW